ncbi:MAG TPA: helix-turn-helix transcriptional regulator [Acidimicrobiales bacterium]|nr:helix-turn-helix transcriptional regulator [Acidimicrobiales bacterium]
MEGKWLASDFVRGLRRSGNLSQRALARLADVPQPTIAEIEAGRREPGLTLLSTLAEATGQILELRLSALDRYSTVAVARRIAQQLDPDDGDDRSEGIRVDGALRAVLDFRDALRRSEPSQFDRLVVPAPALTGFTHWDAFLAGIVEDECARRNVSPPRWTNDQRRFAKPFWYLSDNVALHEWELETAPAALVRHGVLAAAAELESV